MVLSSDFQVGWAIEPANKKIFVKQKNKKTQKPTDIIATAAQNRQPFFRRKEG